MLIKLNGYLSKKRDPKVPFVIVYPSLDRLNCYSYRGADRSFYCDLRRSLSSHCYFLRCVLSEVSDDLNHSHWARSEKCMFRLFDPE